MDNIILRERQLRWLDANGLPVHAPTTSVVLGGTRIQETSRSTTNELEEHSQQRRTKDGARVGGSRGDSS